MHEPNQVFFDIGANVGQFTNSIFELWGKQRYRETIQRWKATNVPISESRYAGDVHVDGEPYVHAFEPHPKTFKILNATSYHYPRGHVILNHMGVGEKVSHLTFYSQNNVAGNTQGGFIKVGRPVAQVQVTSVDAYVKSHHIQHVHFIKIDVEGLETDVVNGMKTTIQEGRVNVISFEFGEKWTRPLFTMVSMMDDWGFDTYLVGYKDWVRVTPPYWSATYEQKTIYPSVEYISVRRSWKGHACLDVHSSVQRTVRFCGRHYHHIMPLITKEYNFKDIGSTVDTGWDLLYGGYPHCGTKKLDWGMETGLNANTNWSNLQKNQVVHPCIGCLSTYCGRRGLCRILNQLDQSCHLYPEHPINLRGQRWVFKEDTVGTHLGTSVKYITSVDQVKGKRGIIQRYIDPYLSKGCNKKSEFRMYIAITQTNPLRVYAFRRLWTILASDPYDPSSDSQCMHDTHAHPQFKCTVPPKQRQMLYEEYKEMANPPENIIEKAFDMVARIIHTGHRPHPVTTAIEKNARCFSWMRADMGISSDGGVHVYEINEFPSVVEDLPKINKIVLDSHRGLLDMMFKGKKSDDWVLVKPPIRIVLGGDLLLGKNVPSGKMSSHTCKGFSPSVVDILSRADVRIGNLETPIKSTPAKRPVPPIKWGSFHSLPENLNAIRGLIDVLTLANNHVLDDVDGLQSTLRHIHPHFKHTGAGKNVYSASRPAVFKNVAVLAASDVRSIRDGKSGFDETRGYARRVSATLTSPGIWDLHTRDFDSLVLKRGWSTLLENRIRQSKQNGNVVVLYMHFQPNIAGHHAKEPYVTFAKKCIDHGVDIFVGQHPHHTQSITSHRGKLIITGAGELLRSYPDPAFDSVDYKHQIIYDAVVGLTTEVYLHAIKIDGTKCYTDVSTNDHIYRMYKYNATTTATGFHLHL